MAEPVDHHLPFLLVAATHKPWLDEASVASLDRQETIFFKNEPDESKAFHLHKLEPFLSCVACVQSYSSNDNVVVQSTKAHTVFT